MTETQIFIAIGLSALVLSVAIFDIYVIAKHGKQESISAYVIRGSKKYPLMVLIFGLSLGIVFGHLFWSMDSEDYMYPEDFKEKCELFLEGEE